MAARLLDYRDNDNDARPSGAEYKDYEAAGSAYGPKNSPLDSKEELEQVLGLPAEIYRLALPHITVSGQQSGIDAQHASPQLLELLKRALSLKGITSSSLSHGMPLIILSPSAKRSYHVFSTASLPTGVTFTRDAVVNLAQRPDMLPTFGRWMRRFDAASNVSLESSSVPEC